MPRSDLLHRQHPLVIQEWIEQRPDFDARLDDLVGVLMESSQLRDVTPDDDLHELGATTGLEVLEQTMIFCNSGDMAFRVAKALVTERAFLGVVLACAEVIDKDLRRERIAAFR